jgi:hypothetical protein
MTTATIGELVADYAALTAEIDEAELAIAVLVRKKNDLKSAIRHMMTEQGLDRTSSSGLTLSVVTKLKARCEPDKWPSVVRWAVENGYDHIVQRRLTDAKVLELVDNGIALPDGLGVETYPDLSIKKA